jgi:hypothetical protein
MLLQIFGFLELSLTDILDIFLVAVMILAAFRWIKGSVTMSIFIAIVSLYVIRVIVSALDMRMTNALMETVLDVGVIALIIIFQPEIRRFLIQLGNRYIQQAGKQGGIISKIFGLRSRSTDAHTAHEISDACSKMSASKTGALIVLPKANDLNDIAARYGVSVNDIMAANGLKGKKLKSRMKLTIPAPGEYAAAENLSEETVEVKDSTAIVNKAEEENVAELPWWHNFRKDKVTATLLLPMKANGISSSWSNMDFYSGVLLAVNDISQNGTDVDLRVHDITDGKIEACRNDIRISDFVIGPVSSRDLGNTLMAEPSHMIISPLDPKAEELVATNPNMIQAPTPHKVQYDDLVSWMKEDMGVNDRVIVISEKGGRQTEAVTEMKRSIDSSGLAYRTFSYSILEGRDVLVPLKELMADDGSNRVLIASESEAFVNDVVRNLNLMIHQKYNVVLYAASKIRSFDTIEVENFHKTNLHVSLTYYIDYDDPRVKNFLLKYRALFNTEPRQFAFQGYDIAS